jgi:hypothetical protein
MPARGLGQSYQGMNFIRKDLRLAIYLRGGMACTYCAATLEDGARLTVEHVVCRTHGGSDTADNLVVCCQKCNSSRSDRPVEDFAATVAGYINRGVTAEQILDGIREQLAQDIRPFRAEAKAIMARRPTWQAALAAASSK